MSQFQILQIQMSPIQMSPILGERGGADQACAVQLPHGPGEAPAAP